MPKKIEYTSEEFVILGQILLEKIAEKISRDKEDLGICADELKENIKKNRAKYRRTKSKLTKALSDLDEEKILKIFDEEFEIGSDERNRITARIRGKREKVKPPIKLAENYLARSTIEELEDMKGEVGFNDEMSINEVVLKLIEYFHETFEEYEF